MLESMRTEELELRSVAFICRLPATSSSRLKLVPVRERSHQQFQEPIHLESTMVSTKIT